MGLAFERLTDRCQAQGWVVELAHSKRGWELSVKEGAELLARSRSTMTAPGVFDRLAIAAVVSLEKQR